MNVIHEENHRPIKCWTDGVELDDSARKQLLNVATLPFIHKHIAVMPDVHWGRGATVGSVIPTIRAIVPAAVGVDIGCGMMAQKTSLRASDLPSNLKELRDKIEKAVPHGRTDNGGRNDRGAWGTPPDIVTACFGSLQPDFASIVEAHPRIGSANSINHLGTLGTGNHFIELCIDENQDVWLMLHSGSRGVGNRIGSYFIERARKHMERWFVNLPDKDLAYLPEGEKDFTDYIKAVNWAQEFARTNRELMMGACLGALASFMRRAVAGPDEPVVNCHHNYVSKEKHYGESVWVTRKGAVCATRGKLGIIPGSMGAKSFIVSGKGNPEAFHSCSHGAGRRMSRGEARRQITLEDHIKATEGVECRKDKEVIDESPAAYKDIDAVMAAQSDLVDIVHTLSQVLCVKG